MVSERASHAPAVSGDAVAAQGLRKTYRPTWHQSSPR